MIHHVALQYCNEENANIFFNKILGYNVEKEFSISSDLSNKIFGIDEETKVIVFEKEGYRFEIFISDKNIIDTGFNHICIVVESKDEFIKSCKNFNLKTEIIDKNGKQLLFVKDFSNNYYEIKEK